MHYEHVCVCVCTCNQTMRDRLAVAERVPLRRGRWSILMLIVVTDQFDQFPYSYLILIEQAHTPPELPPVPLRRGAEARHMRYRHEEGACARACVFARVCARERGADGRPCAARGRRTRGHFAWGGLGSPRAASLDTRPGSSRALITESRTLKRVFLCTHTPRACVRAHRPLLERRLISPPTRVGRPLAGAPAARGGLCSGSSRCMRVRRGVGRPKRVCGGWDRHRRG